MHGWSGPHEVRGRAWVRKEPCNFGWDWGPALVTCGIWRPIRIVAFNTARLADLAIRQDHSSRGAVSLTIDVSAQTTGRAKLVAAITLAKDGQTVAETRVDMAAGKARAGLAVARPGLWWPNGMGEQPLYDVKVDLLTEEGELLDT